jgi:hypothetical protein
VIPGPPNRPIDPPGQDRTPPGLSVKVRRKGARRFLVVRTDEVATLRGAGRARTLGANRTATIAVRRGKLLLVARDGAGNETVKTLRVR